MRQFIVLLVLGFVWHYSLARDVNFLKNFKKIGSKYYHIQNNEKLNWYDARDTCRSMDAHLVSIQNYKEWDAITDHLTNCKSYWVDINDVRHDDEFISETTGLEAPYFKWSHGQPRIQDNYECVKLQAGCHCMKTKYCSQENYYICEANTRPVTTTTSTTHKPGQRYEIIDLRHRN